MFIYRVYKNYNTWTFNLEGGAHKTVEKGERPVLQNYKFWNEKESERSRASRF